MRSWCAYACKTVPFHDFSLTRMQLKTEPKRLINEFKEMQII